MLLDFTEPYSPVETYGTGSQAGRKVIFVGLL